MTCHLRFGLFALGLAAATACSSQGGHSTPSAEPQESVAAALVGTNLSFAKSFVVVDQPSLGGSIATDFAMGTLLYNTNQYLASITPQWNIDHPQDQRQVHINSQFALKPFQGGSADVVSNNASPQHIGTVVPTIDSFGERVVPFFNPDQNKVGPFRLLAVVNRLDLAGDFDLRPGSQLAAGERRWFGEGRLVFGLSNPLDATTPFPMTFIMEFRLPALTTDQYGNIVVDSAFDFANGPVSNDDWIARRKLWAQMWTTLSTLALGSAQYVSTLHSLVAAFATGDNHLALRTGERVRNQTTGALTNEFEYREFYLSGTWELSTRKLRREPFACSQKSNTLVSRINSDWNTSTNALVWDYLLGARNMTSDEITETTARCGGALPYGQTGANGTEFMAKFTRFMPNTVWSIATPEPQRHQMALGTCSGCHSGETNAAGFQIQPSLVGQNAKLSTFLSSKTSATPNGVTYFYDEPGRRMSLFAGFAAGTDVPGDMLHNLSCHDANTCVVP